MPYSVSQPLVKDDDANISLMIDDKTMKVSEVEDDDGNKVSVLGTQQGVIQGDGAVSVAGGVVSLSADGTTIVQDDNKNYKMNMLPQAPLVSNTVDGVQGMKLDYNTPIMKVIGSDNELGLNYISDGNIGAVDVNSGTIKTLYDGTTVTADNGQLTRMEQFSFTDNANSNGFSIVEAASKKRSERKLQVVTAGE